MVLGGACGGRGVPYCAIGRALLSDRVCPQWNKYFEKGTPSIAGSYYGRAYVVGKL